MGWREDDGVSKVDTSLRYGSGSFTTGNTTIDAGLVRIEESDGPKWIEPTQITSISRGVLSRLNEARG
jgi:hypothetical protein